MLRPRSNPSPGLNFRSRRLAKSTFACRGCQRGYLNRERAKPRFFAGKRLLATIGRRALEFKNWEVFQDVNDRVNLTGKQSLPGLILGK